MKTLILEQPGLWKFAETPDPGPPGPGEARVRVRAIGICGTDIHAHGGRQPFFQYPRILGHELGVEVEAVGRGVSHLAVGDRCAVEPYLSGPGDNAYDRGRTNCAAATVCLGVHVDGGMREHLLLPAANLHRSELLDFPALALVETLGIGRHAVERASLQPWETVAVLGLGPIGLTVVQSAMLSGNSVIGLDISEARVEGCRKLFPGVEARCLDPDVALEEQWAHPSGRLPDVVLDSTGNRASMEAAIHLAGHGGRVVLVGIVNDDLRLPDPVLHRKELTLVCSRNSLPDDFKSIIRLMEARMIDVDSWITHRCDFKDFPAVFPEWIAPGSGLLKGLVHL